MTNEETYIATLLYRIARDIQRIPSGTGSYILIHYDEESEEIKSDWMLCETEKSINALTKEIITVIEKMDMGTIEVRKEKI